MADPARARRRRDRSAADPAVGMRFLTLLAIVLSLALVVWVLVTTVVMPRIRISRIIVRADFEMARADLLRLAGLEGEQTYFSVDAAAVSTRLSAHPQIRSATVERVFPDTVRLSLERRRAVVLVLATPGTETVPAVVDEEGVIFDVGDHLAGRDLPVLSGIEIQGGALGARLPQWLSPTLRRLGDLRVSSPQLFGTLSELRVETRPAGAWDLLVYSRAFRVPVRMDGAVGSEDYTYALMVLDVLSQQGIAENVAEVDVRSGEIVYRLKEEEDGR